MTQAQTADDIRRALSVAFEDYVAELRQAGPHWERLPAAGEGEEAWSARQVAEHVASSLLLFGAGISRAIGVDGPRPSRLQFASVDEALSGTRESNEAFTKVIAGVTEESMAIEIVDPRAGTFTVGGILDIALNHFGDHASQLKALREA